MKFIQIQRGRVANFVSRPWREKCLVAQAIALLPVLALVIKFVPFRHIAPRLGAKGAVSPFSISAEDRQKVHQVSWAVRRVAEAVPGGKNCFAQAAACKLLLGRMGVGTTMYFGVSFREDPSEAKAHAWLRSGKIYVVGGDGSMEYSVVASFA